jgi:hypothetical protein
VRSGRQAALGAILLIAAGAGAAAPAAARAATPWQSGPLVESQDVNCVDGIVEQEAGSFLSYQADPSNPPQVGQTYYVAIDLTGLGNTCAGIYADVELALPGGTVPAVSPSSPVRCFLEFPGASSFQEDTSSDCPQALGTGLYGYSLDPAGVDPPFWPLPRGGTVEVQVPVVSSQPLNGAEKLQGVIQLADGEYNPVLTPTLAMIVNPASTPPAQQLGIAYPSPSLTANAQQPNTSTTVGIRGYVWNYSNPGHAVAQVAYADAAGDCTSPGTLVYTSNQVSLQNPQTEISGSVNGLFADVAYCWRIVATVSGGAQAGTYEGNWQYFVTAGTYHAYAGEPPAATRLESGQCSADGGGCETSPCAGSSCAECPGTCLTGFSGGKTTVAAAPAAGPGPASAPPPPAAVPNTVIRAHPKAKLKTRRAKAKVRFRFGSDQAGASFRCALDRGKLKRCTSPATYAVKPGRHRFRVEAVDAAGADPTPASFSFKVVRRKPHGKRRRVF